MLGDLQVGRRQSGDCLASLEGGDGIQAAHVDALARQALAEHEA
jgi:hypothetical protein